MFESQHPEMKRNYNIIKSQQSDDREEHDDRSYFSPARKLEREREDGWTDEAAETSLKIIFEIAKEREAKKKTKEQC